MERKSLFKSKTVAVNTIVALTALYPPAATLVAAHPQETLLVLAGVNLILRLVTKKKIQIFPEV